MPSRLSAVVRRGAGPALALALGLTVALGLAEGAVRASGTDARLMGRSLWWQTVDLEAHRISSDPFLHYELRPGADLAASGPWGPTRITVNAEGARGAPFTAAKPAGVTRALCFGGSSMFGAGVGDDQTVCARLGRHLASAGAAPGGVEAINFGVDAYNLAQMAHLALDRIPRLAPDAVVVLLSNTGRRAFLLTPRARAGDHGELAALDGWLHEENFPAPAGLSPALHRLGMRRLALYRAWAGWRALGQHGNGPQSAAGDALSRTEAARLTATCAKGRIPLLYAAIPAAIHARAEDVHPGLAPAGFLALADPSMPPGYREVHPAPAVLDEWARRIAEALLRRGLLPSPARVSGSPTP